MTPYDNLPDDKLDEALAELEQKVHRKEAIARKLPKLRRELEELERRELHAWGEYLLEEEDVDKLNKRSPGILLLKLRGKFDERLDKEEREMAEAKARHTAVASERDAVAARIKDMEREDKQLGLCREHYAELLERKRKLILTACAEDGGEFAAQQKAASEAQGMADEYAQVMDYGRRVLALCDEAQAELIAAEENAETDAWTGRTIVGAGIRKYDHLESAQSMLSSLSRLLSEFRTELSDVASLWPSEKLIGLAETNVVPSALFKAADLLYDGLSVDFSSLHKVRESLRRISDLRSTVSHTLDLISPDAEKAEKKAKLEKDKLELLIRQR